MECETETIYWFESRNMFMERWEHQHVGSTPHHTTQLHQVPQQTRSALTSHHPLENTVQTPESNAKR